MFTRKADPMTTPKTMAMRVVGGGALLFATIKFGEFLTAGGVQEEYHNAGSLLFFLMVAASLLLMLKPEWLVQE